MFADVPLASARRRLTRGDEAILRFVAATEILETDFWPQYNELGGIQDSEVPGGTGNPAYTAALAVLDSDMAQYIHDTPTTSSRTSRSSTPTSRRGVGNRFDLPPVQDVDRQHGNRRTEHPQAHEPDAADRRHELVDAVSQR
jgi:hypothetical protein